MHWNHQVAKWKRRAKPAKNSWTLASKTERVTLSNSFESCQDYSCNSPLICSILYSQQQSTVCPWDVKQIINIAAKRIQLKNDMSDTQKLQVTHTLAESQRLFAAIVNCNIFEESSIKLWTNTSNTDWWNSTVPQYSIYCCHWNKKRLKHSK